ncbi:hypothetical protein LTR56_005110 [Elasticomyces elasticus]|nr:hypothetical protein LTR22_022001 [Elasticomyces elasticus]KAK3652400.1 hypothetical protein LTR56_005110 [Elasticomyces elasticus]KAK4921268.1 hypothetical protein LTR49_011271 [Elasticomyces elasticus]KAK5759720.1 hypothetical protein LTS12_010237 [Elasticomyces elasticus]
MADTKPAPPPRPTTTSSNPAASQNGTARNRLPRGMSNSPRLAPVPELPRRHTSSQAIRSPDLLRRRSSILSDATSFTEDLINPSTRRAGQALEDDEVTHWHSTPLAFALLPALGGLLFKNGSAFTTDVLLLALAAVFMNWSIRVPWDLYYSAQRVRKDVETNNNMMMDEDDEIALETGSSAEDSPKQKPSDGTSRGDGKDLQSSRREKAAAKLRRQEMLGLFATVLFPALAAYLLHVIRSQLSRPSTGLVSDYNLSIFLLAAEIRPARQLGRLISKQTLHLQRVVNGVDDVFSTSTEEKDAMRSLTDRIADLEAKFANDSLVPSNAAIEQKAEETAADIRKRFEPRIDGLERAVRRYEKRSTTQTMLTEQRLNHLENQIQETMSIAAVVAQHSQRRPGVFAWLLQTVSTAIALPMKFAWAMCVWPVVVLGDLYEKVKEMMLGPAPSKSASAKRRVATKDGSADEKPRMKSSMRRPVR